jgi:hypothetical protein
MPRTLVIQSHRSPLPYPWITRCLDSVRQWCSVQGYDYRFMGDELFALVPEAFLAKTQGQKVIASDLGRLAAVGDALESGYETVIWLDADFLIFNPDAFAVPEMPYAVGREVWVQEDKSDGLKVYKKVHNAFLLFRQGNSFLDFYMETAGRMLSLNEGTVPPQFVGPKLLTALHNVAILPVMETAGMVSPLVIKDLIQKGGDALGLFVEHSPQPIAGANLCISSREREEVSCDEMERLIDTLQDRALPF